jgi:hypothetical protein
VGLTVQETTRSLGPTLRAFTFGLVRPFALLWGLKQNPERFRLARRAAGLQLLGAVLLAAPIVWVRLEADVEAPALNDRVTSAADAGPHDAHDGGAPAGDDDDKVEADDEAPEPPPAPRPWWKQVSTVAFSAFVVAQWVVLAWSRDFQDRTSRDLALLVGLEPEEPDITPRLRLDTKWLRRKLRRRVRGVRVLAPGFVAALPVFLVAALFDGWELATSTFAAAWSFYWWWSSRQRARPARGARSTPRAPLRRSVAGPGSRCMRPASVGGSREASARCGWP